MIKNNVFRFFKRLLKPFKSLTKSQSSIRLGTFTSPKPPPNKIYEV